MKASIIYGGVSSERYVSLLSIDFVIKNIKKLSNVELTYIIYIEADGRIKYGKYKDTLPHILNNGYTTIKSLFNLVSLVQFDADLKEEIGVVYSLLYGEYGEDGKLSTLFDMCYIPHTCNSPIVDAHGMSKIQSFRQLNSYLISHSSSLASIPTYGITHQCSNIPDALNFIIKEIGTDIVVKPADLGASLGVKAFSSVDFTAESVIEHITKHIPYTWEGMLVQPRLIGREFNISLLLDENLKLNRAVLNEILIDGKQGVLNDLDAKHGVISCSKEILFCDPHELSVSCINILNDAIAFVTYLGATMPCRLDCIYSDDKFYLLEVNTLPGISSKSIIPKAIQYLSETKGVEEDYSNQIDRMLRLGHARTECLKKKKYSTDIDVKRR